MGCKGMDQRRFIINISSNIIAFTVNVLANFLLTPYLISLMSTEAYSFYPLANDFVQYATIFTTILNAGAARFVSVEYHKGNLIAAKEYYSSIIIMNGIIGVGISIISGFLILNLQKLINVPDYLLTDVKWLFAFVFLTFIINLVSASIGICTIVRNRLELTSLRKMESTIIQFAVIFGLLFLLPASIIYIGFGTAAAAVFVFITNIIYAKKLLPGFRIARKFFSFNRIKSVLSLGIWNSFNNLSTILFTGFNVLLANIFLSPNLAGEFSVARTFPNFIIVLLATIVTVFAPKIYETYAHNDKEGILHEVIFASRVVTILVSVPVAILLVVGKEFFSLWVPGEDSLLLAKISTLLLIPIVFDCCVEIFKNVFTAYNKLKIPAIVFVFLGAINLLSMIVLLRLNIEMGVYILVVPTLIIRTGYDLLFVVPYACRCLECKKTTIYKVIIKNIIMMIIIISIGCILNQTIIATSWIMLVVKCIIIGIIGLLLCWIIILDNSSRYEILGNIKRIPCFRKVFNIFRKDN